MTTNHEKQNWADWNEQKKDEHQRRDGLPNSTGTKIKRKKKTVIMILDYEWQFIFILFIYDDFSTRFGWTRIAFVVRIQKKIGDFVLVLCAFFFFELTWLCVSWKCWTLTMMTASHVKWWIRREHTLKQQQHQQQRTKRVICMIQAQKHTQDKHHFH